MRESNPSAIVSGSATGIGRACAALLAQRGFNITVNYSRSKAEAELTAEQCRAAGGDTVIAQGDVSDDASCRRIVDSTLERWGRIDALVNNAGTTRFVDARDLDALDRQDFERIMAVNLIGAYQLTRAAAPALRQSNTAAVVNVSSHSGFSGIGSSIAYAASKGALNTLTLSLARVLAPEIRVNAVCPGFADTRWMSKDLDDEAFEAFKARVAEIAPLKRVVAADDVAEAVAWFILGGRCITGQLLVIDGGTHLTVGDPM